MNVTWTTEQVDLALGIARHRARMEIVAGPRAGDVVEDVALVTAWTPERWTAAVDNSRFRYGGLFDGAHDPPAEAAPGATGGLVWHELTRG